MLKPTLKAQEHNTQKSAIQQLASVLVFNLGHFSKTAFLSCIITTLLCGCLYLTLVSPTNIVKWTPYLATYNGDDDIYVTASVLSDKKTPVYSSKVVLLGDSTFREAIYENTLQASLQQNDSSLEIVDLRTGGQTLLESLAIIDALPEGDNSLLVMGTSIRKFIITTDAIDFALKGSRRGFTSEAVDTYLATTGVDVRRKTGIYAIDNFHFLMPRFIDYLQRPFADPIKRIKHQSFVRQVPDRKRVEWLSEEYLKRIELSVDRYLQQIQPGKVIFEKIHTIGLSKGYKFLIVETPLNPDFVQDKLGEDFLGFYLESNSAYFSSNFSNLFYDKSFFELEIASSQFRDVNHLQSEEAVFRYTQSMEEVIPRVLNQ